MTLWLAGNIKELIGWSCSCLSMILSTLSLKKNHLNTTGFRVNKKAKDNEKRSQHELL